VLGMDTQDLTILSSGCEGGFPCRLLLHIELDLLSCSPVGPACFRMRGARLTDGWLPLRAQTTAAVLCALPGC
jgi:hypothetical protein